MIHRWCGLILFLVVPIGCSPQEQAPACAAFVTCVQAIDLARGSATNVKRFEPDGDCWGGAAGAKLCGDACERGLQVLRETEGAQVAGGAP